VAARRIDLGLPIRFIASTVPSQDGQCSGQRKGSVCRTDTAASGWQWFSNRMQPCVFPVSDVSLSEEIPMTTDILHLHEPHVTSQDYVGYTSGITGVKGPGPCSATYLLVGPDGQEITRELMKTDMCGTGHDAEYLAVRFLTKVVTSQFPYIRTLCIMSSNLLVVNQLCGRWRIRVERYQKLVHMIQSTLEGLHWYVTWIPGGCNPLKPWHWEQHKELDSPDSKGDPQGSCR
jgi:hypothetical protein